MGTTEAGGITVRERVGVAVNTANLATEQGASTVVAALGSAAMVRGATMYSAAWPLNGAVTAK